MTLNSYFKYHKHIFSKFTLFFLLFNKASDGEVKINYDGAKLALKIGDKESSTTATGKDYTIIMIMNIHIKCLFE